jgi:xanthine dehydrogenase large subunit
MIELFHSTQVVAEALGIDLNKVHVSSTGTDRIPNASATAASMGSDLYCKAALDACNKVCLRSMCNNT